MDSANTRRRFPECFTHQVAEYRPIQPRHDLAAADGKTFVDSVRLAAIPLADSFHPPAVLHDDFSGPVSGPALHNLFET